MNKEQPNALRAQIGQGEPVAWGRWEAIGLGDEPMRLVVKESAPTHHEKRIANWFPLYTHPAPQQKPLTDEQMRDVLKNTNHMVRNSMYSAFWPELEQACRAVESAATEPLLQRIAELEENERAFKQVILQMQDSIDFLQRQLEEAQKQISKLEEAHESTVYLYNITK